MALADTRVVVCPPGLGDDVQAIKAGTLEIADVLAVSKGDLPLAAQTAREMREMLTLRRRVGAGEWAPQVVVVSALARTGLVELLGALDGHRVAVGVGRRAASESPPIPRAIAPGPANADAWRERIAALVASDALCTTLGITFRAGGGPRRGRADGRLASLNFNGVCHGGAISRSPIRPSAWRRTRTDRSRRASTPTSPSRPRSAPATR